MDLIRDEIEILLSEFLTMLATEAIRRQNTAVNDTIDADISIDR